VAGDSPPGQAPAAVRTVRIAVVSDIHASGALADKGDTYAKCETRDDARRNPLAALRQLVGDEALEADLLLCPGDLANKINGDGLEYAWNELKEIAGTLGARRVIATIGNHDVTRGEDLPDGADAEAWIAALRGLDPPFPAGDPDDARIFFSEDFLVLTEAPVRIILLNSCARHGVAGEFARGSCSDKTRADIEQVLDQMNEEPCPINILLCHHHPIEWRHMSPDDTSRMEGGEALLAMLEGRADPSEWIVIHGHRHVAALGYVGESTSAPVRFSAGSLAINLHTDGRQHARNQFYILEFELDELERLELTGAGRFRAWDFTYSVGMVAAADDSDLPSRGGFGFRRKKSELAALARQAVPNGQRSVTWDELLAHNRRWGYVAPADIRQLRFELERMGHTPEPRIANAPTIERIGFARNRS